MRGPIAQHQRQIGFTGLALAELFLQVFERAALFGDQQNAAGFPVQAMHQLQKTRLGPGHAQLLDDAKAHTRTAMHRHARGFVQRQKSVVFVHNGKAAAGSGLGR